MTLKALETLARSGQLKEESPDTRELQRMLLRARQSLDDAGVEAISEEGRFLLIYQAAHTLALGALRRLGYRSDKRYLVFQCLEHTMGYPHAKWRIFDACHRRRNLAEYEGHLDITEGLLAEFQNATATLLDELEALLH